MDRFESKYKNTAKKMSTALIQLLNKKDFQDISITEICEIANVNRSTFYSHYQNTHDLLDETMEIVINNFLNEYKELSDGIETINISKMDTNEVVLINEKYLMPYLNYIKKHKYLYKICHKNSSQFKMKENLQIIINAIIGPALSKFGVKDEKIINYMGNYYLSGINAIINEWIDRDCVDDMVFVCEIINLCVRPYNY